MNEEKLHEAVMSVDVWNCIDVIFDVIEKVACRRRLSRDDADDLRSVTFVKLLERRRGIAKFESRSSLATYLFRIVDRLWIDLVQERWGRWRPLARSRRLGTTVVELDRLIRRDGESPARAVDRLLAGGPRKRSAEALAALAPGLVAAARARSVPLETDRRTVVPEPVLEERERRDAASRVIAAMRRALRELPPLERQVLRWRYLERQSAASTAARLAISTPEVYRTTYSALDRLEGLLKGLGIDAATVSCVADPDRLCLLAEGTLFEEE